MLPTRGVAIAIALQCAALAAPATAAGPIASTAPEDDAIDEVFHVARTGRDVARAGRVEEGLRAIDLAIVAAEKLDYTASDRAALFALKGHVLVEARREAEAATALRRASSLDPGDGVLHLDLGLALLASDGAGDDADEAARELRIGPVQVLQTHPQLCDSFSVYRVLRGLFAPLLVLDLAVLIVSSWRLETFYYKMTCA